MKMRNKGKVHPFTTSSSSLHNDSLSILSLLPAAILALVSFLSLEEREVLAYMITRSQSTYPAGNEDKKKSSSKKQCGHNSPPLFDCDCFHCYTSFWFRWDSSPNREVIHKAIEAIEELSNGENFKNGKSKRRDKLGRRRIDRTGGDTFSAAGFLDSTAGESPENKERVNVVSAAAEMVEVEETAAVAEVDEVELGIVGAAAEVVAAAEVTPTAVVRTHKGLARKVLPDVMGIFSSRLWSLWSPNV